MKPVLPEGTTAEKVAFARNLYRQQQLGRSRVRMRRATRRWIVGGQAVAVALMVGVELGVGSGILPGAKAPALIWALLGAQAMFFVVLTYAVGNLSQSDGVLDERERAQRDHAMALAYRILMVAIVTVAAAALIADTAHVHLISTAQVGVPEYVAQALWFVVSLPLVVMAWTLPDPDPEPESPGTASN